MMRLFDGAPTAELVARARGHFTPNYRQRPLFLVRGEGVWVWDRDGRRYMDLIGGIAVSSLGHGHPRLTRAIAEQADSLIHCSNLYFHEPGLALLDKLMAVSFADRGFLTNSGAESNEAALKLARSYWAVVQGRPERSGILAFHKSFHGRTMATVTLTGQPKYHEGFGPMLPGVHYADFGDLESVQAALDAAGDTIGTIIVEPIQCEGGLVLPPHGFLAGLRKLADARELLLIFDEVQTGVGRCAEWFCYEISGVQPDIMTLAKGLGGGVPVGAMLTSERVAQAFTPGTHASTFGGNPLACRAAHEVLSTIEDEALLDNAFEVGERLQAGLDALARDHSDKVVEARGVGLLRGLELRADDPGLAARVVDAAESEGLLLATIAGSILRFAPPLILDEGHVDALVEILDGVLGSA